MCMCTSTKPFGVSFAVLERDYYVRKKKSTCRTKEMCSTFFVRERKLCAKIQFTSLSLRSELVSIFMHGIYGQGPEFLGWVDVIRYP